MKRRIAGTVLVFESLVIALAIPVAINVYGVAPAVAVPIGLALAAAALVVSGAVDRRHGVAAGWAVQGLVLASGIVVPGMLLLGAMFTALWYGALRMIAAVGARQSQGSETGEEP